MKMQLDDSIVKRIETTVDQDVNESRDLIRRIRRRDLYRVPRHADNPGTFSTHGFVDLIIISTLID